MQIAMQSTFAAAAAARKVSLKPPSRASLVARPSPSRGRAVRLGAPICATSMPGQNAIPEEADDHYLLLQVGYDASDDEIKANYRKLQKIYHPDVWAKGDEKSVQLNEAYKVLIDPKLRADFDKRMGGPRRRVMNLREQEGLYGPLEDEVLVLESAVPFGPRGEDDIAALSDEEAHERYQEAVWWAREWAKTLAFAAELPLPLPVQVDQAEGGARMAFIGVDNGAVRSAGELLFVMTPSGEAGEIQASVFRRNCHKVFGGGPLPGEKQIVKAFELGLRRRRGDKPGIALTGIAATMASGAMGLIPGARNGHYDTDAYHLRRESGASDFFSGGRDF